MLSRWLVVHVLITLLCHRNMLGWSLEEKTEGSGVFFLGALEEGNIFSSLRSGSCVQDLGSSGVPPAGHALCAEVGRGITFVTSGKKT